MFPRHPLEEFLDFGYSTFGNFQVNSELIKITVYDFRVLPGFPGYTEEVRYLEGVVIYEGVTVSSRVISEYATSERKGFKASFRIIDGPFESVSKKALPFEFDGIFEELNAWISWDIEAELVSVEGIRRA